VSQLIVRIALVATMLSTPFVAAEAQQRPTAVETFKDWSVFADDSPPAKVCYAATVPSESEANREGIRRGDVFIFVSTYPEQDVRYEISVKLGYPTDPQKPPRLEIGNQRFTMISDGEEAWLETPEDDSKAVAAMRAGSKATVIAVSGRGTTTTDTFSLLGFTASLKKVDDLCK